MNDYVFLCFGVVMISAAILNRTILKGNTVVKIVAGVSSLSYLYLLFLEGPLKLLWSICVWYMLYLAWKWYKKNFRKQKPVEEHHGHDTR